MSRSPFWIALQFLSSLPVRLPGMPTPAQQGASVLFYPLVGGVFGGLLCLARWGLADVPTLLQAALLLCAWVLLSGALHLDGLADSADAWLGGFGDRERTLQIMKDPRSGPVAVVAVMLVLLLKWCALVALLENGQWLPLLVAPVLARTAMLGLFMSTPYVRAGGLGQALSQHLPRKAARAVLLLILALTVVMGGGLALAVLVLLGVTFAFLRRLMVKRLGGTTGDTAGALLEVLELMTLVGWVVFSN